MAPSYPANAATTSNYIAGGLIGGFIGLVVLLSLLCFFCFRRSRTEKIRIEKQNAGLLHTGEAQSWMIGPSLPPASRVRDKPSITIPERNIPRASDPHSHDTPDKADILLGRDLSPASSKSSLQRPTPNSSPRPRTLSSLNPARSRNDRSSSGFSMYSSNPSPSRSNHRLSSISTMLPLQPKPVRQLFVPSLSDELNISRCGEYLSVLHSFDDGWCLAIRDAPTSSRRGSVLSMLKSQNADVGVVPAWVFAEPIQGSTVTRPLRSSSVNALHVGGKSADGRSDVISWSYF